MRTRVTDNLKSGFFTLQEACSAITWGGASVPVGNCGMLEKGVVARFWQSSGYCLDEGIHPIMPPDIG